MLQGLDDFGMLEQSPRRPVQSPHRSECWPINFLTVLVNGFFSLILSSFLINFLLKRHACPATNDYFLSGLGRGNRRMGWMGDYVSLNPMATWQWLGLAGHGNNRNVSLPVDYVPDPAAPNPTDSVVNGLAVFSRSPL
jgi:hypothetical protein